MEWKANMKGEKAKVGVWKFLSVEIYFKEIKFISDG